MIATAKPRLKVSRSRTLPGIAMALALVAVALVGVTPARGAGVVYPSSPTASFGLDGTSATQLVTGHKAAFNPISKRLYLVSQAGPFPAPYAIIGFDTSTPGSYIPLGAADGFPIILDTNGADGLATDSSSGNIYALGSGLLQGFSANGERLDGFPVGGFTGKTCGAAVDSQGHVWAVDRERHLIEEYSPAGVKIGELDASALDLANGLPQVCNISIDTSNDDLFARGPLNGAFNSNAIHVFQRNADGYSPDPSLFADIGTGVRDTTVDRGTHRVFVATPSEVIEFSPDGGVLDTFAAGVGFLGGIGEDPTTHTAYVVASDKVHVFVPLVTPDALTAPPTNVTTTSATLNGHADPLGAGDASDCSFEWGPVGVPGFPNQVPCDPLPPYSSPIEVSADVGGLNPGTEYHYRLTATNVNGTTPGTGIGFQTVDRPVVATLYSSDLSPTTAIVHAAVNPQGADTTYHFEYGTTANYGSSIPVPAGVIGDSFGNQSVSAQLTGLQEGVIYHFRVVATNAIGTTVSRDQTFNFLPPPCPNAQVRQQTGSDYLPDCRAYELVSPDDAGNVVLVDQGIPAPYATSPTRFSFAGMLGAIRGTDPPNSLLPDSYVATRSPTGWRTEYVGIPGNEIGAAATLAGSIDMDRFLSSTTLYINGVPQPPNRIPYISNGSGDFVARWPGNWSAIPGANATLGAFQPSPDFSHLAFSSNNVAFSPNGLTAAPGSAYVYDVEAETTTIISKTAAGDDIPQEPGAVGFTEDYILFPGNYPATNNVEELNPGVSTDGSHILMGTLSAPTKFYLPPLPPQHLYMRIDNAVTYDVSRGHHVDYVGMTADGSRVYFMSPEQLTGDDTDNSVDIYMWSEDGDSLTRVSRGDGTAGDSDACNAAWTSACDVSPVQGFANTDNSTSGYLADTDHPIATKSGDLYFYSPEQLDGSKGLPGAQNLYVYRDGAPHFVIAFTSPAAETCDPATPNTCSAGPIGRIQVSPDGKHMAFVTPSRITSYDNAGDQQMYSYDPASGKILCVSCLPDGSAPTGDVRASNMGLFMSDDGRTFFTSPDALVPRDSNGLFDVYEFVEGRPQLISSGTASTVNNGGRRVPAGLAGVSADGVNVYFSTYDTLVANDHNGPFRKFYVARTNGGFLQAQPSAPCKAADECHGADSSPPQAPPVFSDGNLGAGGNLAIKRQARKRRCNAKRKRDGTRNAKRKRNAKRRQQRKCNAKRGRNELRKKRQRHRRHSGKPQRGSGRKGS